MGIVLQFRSKNTDNRLDCAKLEEELAFPSPPTATRLDKRPRLTVDDQLPARKAFSNDAKFPSAAIAILTCAIIASVLISFHLTGQPHYSARANLQPSVFRLD
ncbi:hypothetical protein CCGE525_12070 [Rhizobium jaguaris]|uniref:Uncharacterized protein n=1 Tax=Rhizobium jaguaris TaxID=1312183 RepID=A0A387FJC4_9HYPH|nr:hypothetical protein CCGE525_12070 [Rhizobium jaguaris]